MPRHWACSPRRTRTRSGPGPAARSTVAPLFLLYDYTFRAARRDDKESRWRCAYDAGVVCTDEFLLHPDPYPSRDAWCRARVARDQRRLAAR